MAYCKRCDGTGSIDCAKCEGAGKYDKFDAPPILKDLIGPSEYVECKKCDGTGQIKCPNCRGTGEV